MNYFALTGLANGIVSASLGATVYFLNKKSWVNKTFALYALSLAIWSFFYCAWQTADTPELALFLSRGLMAGAIFIPIFHFHHILQMFGLKQPYLKKILFWGYVASIGFFITNFTPLFVSTVEMKLFFPFWPVPGPLFAPYLVLFGALVIISLVLIWNYRKKASPLMRNGVVWITIATSIGYGGGATNFLLWYDVPFPPYLNILVPIFLAADALLFFRLQLFDVRLFLRDTTVHILSSSVIGMLGAIIIYPLTQNLFTFLYLILFAIFVPLLYKPISSWIRDTVNKTRLGKVDQYLNLIGENIDKIRETTYTYDDLAKNIVDSIMNTFPVGMVSVYFQDMEKQQLQLRAHVGMKNPLTKDLRFNRSALAIKDDDPLIKYLSSRNEVVIREAIQMGPRRRSLDIEVSSSLGNIEAEACVPFVFAGTIKGLLVLGRKTGNQMFHKEDLKAIRSFGRMGEEIMRYIMGMEHEVHHTATYSHDMNNDTKSLLQVLQFLQSPLAEGTPKEDVRLMLKQAEDVMSRLNQTFQLNRDRSSLILRSIKGEYDKQPLEISKLIKESCSKFDLRAKKDKIDLRVNIPNSGLSINGNPDDLIRVMDNLLINAFRYVAPQGIITISVEETAEYFRVTVEDNGQGIAPEDMERIWKFGWQAKDAKQGATGLGLSIARQIIYLHGGKIWVESPGEDKGTKFIFVIPLKETEQENQQIQTSSERDIA